MYSISQIQELQKNEDYFKTEGDKYCLVSLTGKDFTLDDLDNQCNFCILQIIDALKKNYLTKQHANFLINKIDALHYSKDLMGPEKIIYKLNKEIIEDELHIPHFNLLCVICSDVYDSNW